MATLSPRTRRLDDQIELMTHERNARHIVELVDAWGLARDRMATFQELADEAFADLLKKHGIPIDLKDALRKSARLSKTAAPKKTRSKA